MESDKDIIINLKENVSKLIKIENTQKENEENKINDENYLILQKVVDYFDIILSNNFKIKKENDLPPEENNYYNAFITKHFNTPLIRFFILYKDTLSLNNNNNNNNSYQKNWIFLSILENSFSDCVIEIYRQNLYKDYYSENALLIKNKSEIKTILKNIKNIDFKNIIKSKDFNKYEEFLEEQSISSDYHGGDSESQISGIGVGYSTFSLMSTIKKIDIKQTKENEENIYENYELQILKDFSNTIENNFYTFIPGRKEHERGLNVNINTNNINNNSRNLNINTGNTNNNLILPSQEEDLISIENSNMSNSDSEDDPNIKTGLVLNPVHNKYLPIDNLYQVKNKPINREYNLNDELIYNKQLTPMTNSHLLYLNSFYKKSLYHKFFKTNLHQNPISLKSQNYQCFICLKKFKVLFNKIPLEAIYWCAYYMRFVCKNCIENEYSIIPFFILSNWSFEKFPISKKAKMILEKWYDKPVVYFKKEERIIKSIPALDEVIQIKMSIHYIYDKLKCDKKKELIEKTLGEYKYLALKEIIFSIRDLVEINNNNFLNKIIGFYDEFVKHVSGECNQCFIQGTNCPCGNGENIFLYDYKNVSYCPVCDKSYHINCKRYLRYMCGHE
jgi:hypothetical protein